MTVSCYHRSRFLLCCRTLVTSWREQVVAYWVLPGSISGRSGVLLCNGQVKLCPESSQQVISNLFIAFMKHGSITYAYYFQTCLLKNPAQYWLKISLSDCSYYRLWNQRLSSFLWPLKSRFIHDWPISQFLWSIMLPACSALSPHCSGCQHDLE